MTADAQLPPVQCKVLAVYSRRLREGLPPPTLRELCGEFGWRSTGTARDHVKALVRKGHLVAAGGRARGASLPGGSHGAVSLPLAGSVAAGVPVVADENVGERISVPAHMVRRDDSFVLRVSGDSMEGAGIFDGDLVVVEPVAVPIAGTIVAVTLDGETTLKRLERTRGRWRLVAENPRYEPIEVGTQTSYLHGMVTAVLRTLEAPGSHGHVWRGSTARERIARSTS